LNSRPTPTSIRSARRRRAIRPGAGLRPIAHAARHQVFRNLGPSRASTRGVPARRCGGGC
jgi:hypothetical protein